MIPIVLGTHEYEWALHPFAELFAKYFGDEKVIYFGDRVEGILPSNLEFQQVPCFSEGEWPWQTTFGEGLKSICYSHLDEILLIFLPDHWINQHVDRGIIDTLESYMWSYPEVIRVNLADDLSWYGEEVEQVDCYNGLDIIEVKPWSIHAGFNGGTSFTPSLWRPELILEVMKSHWNLWECEKLGTEVIKSVYPRIRAIGSNPAALTRTHGLFHSQIKKVSLAGLSEEDRQIVIKSLPNDFTYFL